MDAYAMRVEERYGVIVLLADDGMLMTDGEAYGTEIWLSRFDNIENWREIKEADKPPAPTQEVDEKADMQAAIEIYEGGGQ